MKKAGKNPNMIQDLSTRINTKYLKTLNSFDSQIYRHLRETGIEIRPVNGNGLWCCAILPAVLILNCLMYKVSPVYTLVTYISLGLLFYSLLVILFLSVSCMVLQEPIYGGCIASSVISSLLLYAFLGKGLTVSFLYSLPSIYLYITLLRVSIMMFPKTFTIGEAMIVAQSIVLYTVMMVAKLLDHNIDDETDFIIAIVNTVLSTVAIIVTALSVLKKEQRNLYYLAYVVSGAAMFALILIHVLLGRYSIPRILQYIFMDRNRVHLFTFWLAILLLSVAVLQFRTKLAVKATTVTRKSFHVLASMVFLSGILCDQQLMMLAAGIGLGLLILVEGLRKSGIEPISSVLQSAFLVYSDEKLDHDGLFWDKATWYIFAPSDVLQIQPSNTNTTAQNWHSQDCGSFAMTPFYLYCGLACPLILVPTHPGCQLDLLSGVLSIGIGDTAASWFGSRYGFNKWVGTGKTVEGTTFNILSQMSTIYALQLFDLIDARNILVRTAVAATISGLAEATTVQVDNLVLPIITLLAFQLTWPLCYL